MTIIGASTFAAAHDLLMFWVNVVTIGAFLVVNSALIYFIIRYRKRSDNDTTSAVAQSLPLEITWTIIPAIIMGILGVWGIQTFQEYRADVPNAREVQVRGKQWAWSFLYPRDWTEIPSSEENNSLTLKTSNVLYLEANKPVKLIMKSSDVIHSFFVPAFRIKEDVVPNIFTFINFTPILRDGDNGRAEYDIMCTEYCGKDHSAMLGKAIVLDSEKYLAEMKKIQGEASNVSVSRGQEIHATQCASCHTIDGTRQVGPSWKGIWNIQRVLEDGKELKIDENYIMNSILNPNTEIVAGYPAVMPVQDLSDAEIESVIRYIQILK